MRRELVEDLEWVPKLVADVTCEAGVAVRPMGDEPVVEGLSLVPLSERRVLGVLVTGDGSVEKRVIHLAERVDRRRVQDLENALNRIVVGMQLSRIRGLMDRGELLTREACGAQGLEPGLDELTRELFNESCDDVEVLIAGTENLLLSSDFERIERIRSLTVLLNDRGRIVREWKRLLGSARTQVAIGRESEVTASGRLGMVATLFFRDGRRVGAVGVVGPRRMDYQKIVPVVEFIGDSLTRMLDEGGAAYG
jgi:heat-inducible transcriptional repressor